MMHLFYEFGKHHINPFTTVKADLLHLGRNPRIEIGGFEGEVPPKVDRTNEVRPNHGFDNLKYLTQFSDKKGKAVAWWDQLEEEFPHHKKVIRETRKAVERGKLTITGGKKNTTAEVKGWVVPALKGKPLVFETKYRAWWRRTAPKYADTLPEVTQCWITGETCHPLRLLPKVARVPGTGGKVPFVSYNETPYSFRGRSQGENFPVSPEAGEAYAACFDYALAYASGRSFRYGVSVADDQVLMFLPGNRAESEYLLEALSVLDSYTKEDEVQALWENFHKLKPTAKKVHLILLKGAQGRISILNHTTVTEKELHDNWLKLRELLTNRFGQSSTLRFSLVRRDSLIPSPYHGEVTWNLCLGLPLSKNVQNIIHESYDPDNRTSELWLTYLQGGPYIMKSKPQGDVVQTLLADFDEHHSNQNTPYLVGRLAAVLAQAFESYHRYLHGDRKTKNTQYLTSALENPVALDLRRSQLYFDSLKNKGSTLWEDVAQHLHGKILDPADIQRWTPEQRRDVQFGFAAQRHLNSAIFKALPKKQKSNPNPQPEQAA